MAGKAAWRYQINAAAIQSCSRWMLKRIGMRHFFKEFTVA